ncbi:hypothetical protein NQ315_001524, partial [Exocentrus adspersus]
GNPNGPTTAAHCPATAGSWPDYANSYTPYSPQANYYEPHQESAHGAPIHLPTVLPDPTATEYITTSLTSPPPPAPAMFNSAKADLESMIAPRYPDNNTYCPNNWGANAYPNNNYYNSPYNQQQYLNHHPAIIYPQVYSTVNQNQIHFHLHATPSEKSDQYLGDGVALTPPQRVEAVQQQAVAGEVAQVHDSLRLEESERAQSQQNDPSSVWRPY